MTRRTSRPSKPMFRLYTRVTNIDALMPRPCAEWPEAMVEGPDGTLQPYAQGPSSSTSSAIDNRTRAALDSSVLDGLYSAFDAQDPLSQLTQVADAGNVMNDGVEETSADREAIPMLRQAGTYTFIDKPFASTIPLQAPNAPYTSIETAVRSAANEIRELARTYYTDYDEIPRDWMLPEVGVVFVKIGPDQFTYNKAVIGNVTVSYKQTIRYDEGHTRYDEARPAKFSGRMHFHWQNLQPTGQDRRTAHADDAFVGGGAESWVASYETEARFFKGKTPRKRRSYDSI